VNLLLEDPFSTTKRMFKAAGIAVTLSDCLLTIWRSNSKNKIERHLTQSKKVKREIFHFDELLIDC